MTVLYVSVFGARRSLRKSSAILLRAKTGKKKKKGGKFQKLADPASIRSGRGQEQNKRFLAIV